MDVREKLVELLMDMPYGRGTEEEETAHIESVADYLIENGVTVQEQGEWIKNGWNDYSCSICECQLVGHGASNWKYCPHCGAKMIPKPPKGE